MNILILGGDGYLGWPTAMNLSSLGYRVAVADNYLRRRIMSDERMTPLYQVPDLENRANLWEQISGKRVEVFIGDLTDLSNVKSIFSSFQPDAIVHYAEQPSAPYSMLNENASTLTLINNLSVTNNLILTVREHNPDIHIVKLGTMGEYGTPNIDIEEGWLDVHHNGRDQKFLYPRQAGSLYHTTKIMDTDLLWFYVRTWKLRVTDLMQGPVYGIFTDENISNDSLLPMFSYDELFGTVLNRFMVQAVEGYPLTVYGKGGQTRGYLNIKDTLQCVRLSLENPAEKGELRIFNQFTETFSVNQLADLVKKSAKRLSLDVDINHMPNPRIELEDHYYNPTHTGLNELGLKPSLISEDIVCKIMEFIIRNKQSIEKEQIYRGTKWA